MRSDYAIARYANIVLGTWLFLSAFLWPHSYAQVTNTWVVGLLVVALAVVSLRVPQARYMNAILAVWLFLSAFALPTLRMATVWNNALVAIAVFFVSMLPGYATGGPRTPAGPGSTP
jgi:hypothetical protein